MIRIGFAFSKSFNSSYPRYDYRLSNDVSQLRLKVRKLHLMINEQLVNLKAKNDKIPAIQRVTS